MSERVCNAEQTGTEADIMATRRLHATETAFDLHTRAHALRTAVKESLLNQNNFTPAEMQGLVRRLCLELVMSLVIERRAERLEAQAWELLPPDYAEGNV